MGLQRVGAPVVVVLLSGVRPARDELHRAGVGDVLPGCEHQSLDLRVHLAGVGHPSLGGAGPTAARGLGPADRVRCAGERFAHRSHRVELEHGGTVPGRRARTALATAFVAGRNAATSTRTRTRTIGMGRFIRCPFPDPDVASGNTGHTGRWFNDRDTTRSRSARFGVSVRRSAEEVAEVVRELSAGLSTEVGHVAGFVPAHAYPAGVQWRVVECVSGAAEGGDEVVDSDAGE